MELCFASSILAYLLVQKQVFSATRSPRAGHARLRSRRVDSLRKTTLTDCGSNATSFEVSRGFVSVWFAHNPHFQAPLKGVKSIPRYTLDQPLRNCAGHTFYWESELRVNAGATLRLCRRLRSSTFCIPNRTHGTVCSVHSFQASVLLHTKEWLHQA